MSNQFCVVFVTTPRGRIAESIAKQIISKRLAACVNTVPQLKSIYWWRGKVETAKESLLILKTRKSLVDRLCKVIKKIHPYTVAEVISLPILSGNKPYLDWLAKETK